MICRVQPQRSELGYSDRWTASEMSGYVESGDEDLPQRAMRCRSITAPAACYTLPDLTGTEPETRATRDRLLTPCGALAKAIANGPSVLWLALMEHS